MKLILLLLALALPLSGVCEGIPEIMDLKKNSGLPQAVLEQYDTNTIAESLVEWVRADREKVPKRPVIYDFNKQSRIVIAFNLKNLESIQEKCFLNQHQTGTSNAYLGKDRLIQENKMLGLKLTLSEKEKELLPKYAYLFLDGAPESLEKDNAIVPDYGGVFAKINDRVKKRATFTSGDSLVIQAKPSDLMSFSYPLYKENQIKRNYTAYWETQIWGSLCMEDVDYFLIGCTVAFPDDQIERLKKVTGKPVYRCVKKSVGWKTYSVLPGEGPL